MVNEILRLALLVLNDIEIGHRAMDQRFHKKSRRIISSRIIKNRRALNDTAPSVLMGVSRYA
jgi:hypothetical protein